MASFAFVTPISLSPSLQLPHLRASRSHQPLPVRSSRRSPRCSLPNPSLPAHTPFPTPPTPSSQNKLLTFLLKLRSLFHFLRTHPLPRLLLLLLFLRPPLPTPFAQIALPLPTLPSPFQKLFRPFSEAFSIVFLSEFGDKSMFATALMAMKQSPFLVFIGALVALTAMTFVACFLGQFMRYLPPIVTHYFSIILFVFFGLQMIISSLKKSGTELSDAKEMVKSSEEGKGTVLAKICSLIFVAEWCDRSMLATMALAASSNTLAVVGGATMANVVCTALAVGGAAMISRRVSEKVVGVVSGVLFEVFAVMTLVEGPDSG